MPTSSYPNLSDQQRFWEAWNAGLREPTHLNPWALKCGDTIVQMLGALALGHPRILDLGCGTGWLTERLAQFGPATGIDLAESAIAAARARSPHITYLAGDLFELPMPANHFDVVVSQNVIAHVADQRAFLDRAADVLKPNGYLLLTTPNKFVMDRSDWPPQPPEHLERWLTKAHLKALLCRRFRLLHATTILPLGNRGILGLINSYKVNAAVGRLISRHHLERLKEGVGLGWMRIALAQKRS
jgi:2-polyprenyl-3-methyl-5-hydroxy-6-metoxy-1,4-benzoquinol methylase